MPSASRITGPHVSAWRGTERNCWTRPRSGPSSGTLKSPSFLRIVEGAPSVEIQRFPSESNATLSGHEIGETCSFGKPAKYVGVAPAGSPHSSRMLHPKR